MRGMGRINKAWRLAHVNNFVVSEPPIEICALDVDLVNFEISGSSDSEDGVNR